MVQDESVEIGGKIYLPSGRAAKLVGYTKDYVGQLARAGKLDARLVGRGWYITEDSIRSHKLGVHYELTKPKRKRVSDPDDGKGKRVRLEGNIPNINKDISDINISSKDEVTNREECADLPTQNPSATDPTAQHHNDVPVEHAVTSSMIRYNTSRAQGELLRSRIEFEQLSPYTYSTTPKNSLDETGTSVRLAPRPRSQAGPILPSSRIRSSSYPVVSNEGVPARAIFDGVLVSRGKAIDRSEEHHVPTEAHDGVQKTIRGKRSVLKFSIFAILFLSLMLLLAYLVMVLFIA